MHIYLIIMSLLLNISSSRLAVVVILVTMGYRGHHSVPCVLIIIGSHARGCAVHGCPLNLTRTASIHSLI